MYTEQGNPLRASPFYRQKELYTSIFSFQQVGQSIYLTSHDYEFTS